jgi:DNA replication protein DnaC
MNHTTTETMTLNADLQRLGLLKLGAELDDFLAHATRARWNPRQVLEHLVRSEIDDRARRSVERRLRRSRLGRFKLMADWDWNWPKKIDRPALERLLTLDFMERADNIILLGAQGLGKTTLAKNIAYQAILAGRSALFTTASDLILDLNSQETARALERRIRHYVRPNLLVIDEIGYLSFDAHAADLLFQIVSRRHELRSIVVTTNLAFRDWAAIFPNATCAIALIDRLTHHSNIISIHGDSYRRRHAQ